MPRLNGIPLAFEKSLFDRYREIERNFRERRWAPSELDGGKLCEAAYSILHGHISGSFPDKPSKPRNFPKSCSDLEKADPSFGHSVRILIPKMLIPLYDIRNHRGVGHIGGDVDPNHMDAVCVLHMAKWIVSEFVRIFHSTTTAEAQRLVETLTERHIDVVWEVGDKKRILNPSLTMLEKTLLILYSEDEAISETTLVDYIEHSNPSVYRRDVLRKAHKSKLLEYDAASKTVEISPVGIKRVEQELLD